uniref:Uncharacterized protein n=1 Tax=Gopherus agassizii TaxID=38772 RepID=A0A452IER0_9SAUR
MGGGDSGIATHSAMLQKSRLASVLWMPSTDLILLCLAPSLQGTVLEKHFRISPHQQWWQMLPTPKWKAVTQHWILLDATLKALEIYLPLTCFQVPAFLPNCTGGPPSNLPSSGKCCPCPSGKGGP